MSDVQEKRKCILMGGPLDGTLVEVNVQDMEVVLPVAYPIGATAVYEMTTEISASAPFVMRYQRPPSGTSRA